MCGSGGLSVEIKRTDLVLHGSLSVKRIFGSTSFRDRSRGVKDAAIGRFSIWPLLETVRPLAAVVFEGGMCEGELHSSVFEPGNAYPEPLS
jgi:hypothetical protein